MDILQLIFDNLWKVVLLILSIGMVVYDLAKGVYTIDGERWEEIEEDHL